MKKHIKQIQAWNSEGKRNYFLCGRRGGKTRYISEDIPRKVAQMPPTAEIFYFGPTNQHAYELLWEELEHRFTQLNWPFQPKISHRRFELPGRRKVYIIGAEKHSRIRGHKAFWVYLDELAYFEKDLGEVYRSIQPTLTDYGGGLTAATTPDGKGSQAYEWYLQAKEKPEWGVFSWHTIDNPFIDPKEIETARRELDEKSFRQEYMATWESFEGLAYYNFGEEMHIKKTGPVIDGTLVLNFDFNVNPTTLLLMQEKTEGHLRKLQFKTEYSLKNSSTEETVKTFCEDYKGQRENLRLKIRGDSTGKNRTAATGLSNYHYVEEVLEHYGFNYEYEILSKNPPIIDRLKHANGYLKNVKGESRIEIDPCCRELIRDLSSQPMDGRFPSDKNNLGHKADAFGYSIYYDYLNSNTSEQTTIIL